MNANFSHMAAMTSSRTVTAMSGVSSSASVRATPSVSPPSTRPICMSIPGTTTAMVPSSDMDAINRVAAPRTCCAPNAAVSRERCLMPFMMGTIRLSGPTAERMSSIADSTALVGRRRG